MNVLNRLKELVHKNETIEKKHFQDALKPGSVEGPSFVLIFFPVKG
jgi:hypothetical protein